MKRIVILPVILAILFAVCFSGCAARNDIVVTDCKTGKVVAGFSTKEHQAEAASLTNAMNYSKSDEVSVQTDDMQAYLVHLIDPKDPLYDVWYYAYLNTDSNELYVKFDLEKMKDYNEKSGGMFDDKLYKSSKLTASEFSDIISAKYE